MTVIKHGSRHNLIYLLNDGLQHMCRQFDLLRQLLRADKHDKSPGMKSTDETIHYLLLDVIELGDKIIPCHIGVRPWAVI